MTVLYWSKHVIKENPSPRYERMQRFLYIDTCLIKNLLLLYFQNMNVLKSMAQNLNKDPKLLLEKIEQAKKMHEVL